MRKSFHVNIYIKIGKIIGIYYLFSDDDVTAIFVTREIQKSATHLFVLPSFALYKKEI